MKKIKLVFIFGLLSVFTSGCSKTSLSETIGASTSGFVGQWETACTPSEDKVEIMKFNSDNTLEITNKEGSGSGICDDLGQVRMTASTEFLEASTVVPGATNLNVTILGVYLTPVSAAVASDFNVNAECGLTNWQAGVEQDISSLNCQGLPVGLVFYTVAQVIGNDLFLGEELNGTSGNNGSTLQLRHDSLSPIVRTKVP